MTQKLYHIDSSVLLAAMLEEPHADKITMIWQLSGKKRKYTAIFSALALGEVMKVLKETPAERMKVGFDYLYHLFDWYSLDVYTPVQQVHTLVSELQQVDSRLLLMDAFILASAISHGAEKFITLDNDFLEADPLKSYVRRNHKLIIQHPGDSL